MDNGVYASPPSIVYRAPHYQPVSDKPPTLPYSPVEPLAPTVCGPQNKRGGNQEVRFASPIVYQEDSAANSESETISCSPETALEKANPLSTLQSSSRKDKEINKKHPNCLSAKATSQQMQRDHPAKHDKTVAFGRTTNVSQTVEGVKDIAGFRKGFQPARPTPIQTIMEPRLQIAEKTLENKENANPHVKPGLPTISRASGSSNAKNGNDWCSSFEASQQEIVKLRTELATLKAEMEELKRKDAQRNETLVKLQEQVIDLLAEKKRNDLNVSSISAPNQANRSITETISARHENDRQDTSQNRTIRLRPKPLAARNISSLIEPRRFSPKLELILSSDAKMAASLLADDNLDSMAVSVQHTPIHSLFEAGPPRFERTRSSVTPSRRRFLVSFKRSNKFFSFRYTVEHPPEDFEEFQDDDDLENRGRNQRNQPYRNGKEERQRHIEEIRQRYTNESRITEDEDEFEEY